MILAKDLRAALERHLTAATTSIAAITHAFLFLEMLCYVLEKASL